MLPALFFSFFFFFFFFLSSRPILVFSTEPHTILFRSPNLYPQSLVWDPSPQHFLVGSLRARSITAVSDAGVVETYISDPSLPFNASILGLAVDRRRGRLLAVVHSADPLPAFNALAAYDLRTRRRLFLAPLPDPEPSTRRPVAVDVAADPHGNAYVTNSAENFIWKVSAAGEASVFSRSAAFADRDASDGDRGLTGIAYICKGYLLAVQSSSGRMFKVSIDGGAARALPLAKELAMAEGIAVRGDGVAVVVSPRGVWFLRSDDSWGRGVVYDETALDAGRFPTAVAVGGEDRVYALYGHVEEGRMGNPEREVFAIDEIRAGSEGREESVLPFVLIGLGLAYFLFWRFQMAQLVKNINKKTD